MPDVLELKCRADFLVVVSRYTKLHRAGRQFVGLCPFHFERSPSFYIEPQRKIWKCFGCERGGDLFAFVMLIEHCDFCRAVQILSDFSTGVARASEPRSGERLGASKGGEAPSAREAGVGHSPPLQAERARIIARLDATERLLAMIRATNEVASRELATACEPRGEAASLLVTNRITAPPLRGQSNAKGKGRGKPKVSPMR
ncbi:MAG: CHC2 zinc finger domain-containing protein [Candidatus Acidiferrales bacterium]